eukprot:6781179-Prymnesium_polylepis.2
MLARADGSAPCSQSIRQISTLLWRAARCKAVRPFSLKSKSVSEALAFGLAFATRRKLTTAAEPEATARCSGVMPIRLLLKQLISSVASFTSQPALSAHSHASTLPLSAAKCRV